PLIPLSKTVFEQTHHALEDRFEGTLDGRIAARDIARQRHQGTATVDVIEVLAREVCVNDLSSCVDRREVDVHPRPASGRGLPQRVHDRFGVEVALCLKVAIEPPSREPGMSHDVLYRDLAESVAVKKRPRAPNDGFSRAVAVA